MADSIFEVQLAAIIAKAKGNVDQVVRRVAMDMFSRVIEKSPVDTGRFKSNWLPGINSIPAGTVDAVDKSGGATIARMQAAVLTAKAGDVIYLVNNLAYARSLEYGHSKQAPSGMVRTTIEEFPQVVSKAAAEVPK